MIKLLLISLIVFILNIPFGYWRSNVRKFSLQWALAIHIPVPVIIAMRIFSDLGFAWHTYAFMVLAFFLGQRVGGNLHHKFAGNNQRVSSCLFIDLFRKS